MSTRKISRRHRSRHAIAPAAAAAAAAAAAVAPRRLYLTDRLERRMLFSSVAEVEPNDTAANAQVIPISAAGAADPTLVNATMDYADIDYFAFTLDVRSGVFFDTDARETGLADVLDTRLALLASDGETLIANNDDGRDFDTLALNESSNTPLVFGDSALYADLAAGTYVVEVHSWANAGDPLEPYQLKLTADSSFTATVPVFNSLPGAADTLYLDFDGHSATDAWGSYAIDPFDLNGNGGEWSPAERAAIETTWRVVADAFAPFNINVTTSYGGAYNPGEAFRHVIGNADGSEIGEDPNGLLGIAFLDVYGEAPAQWRTGFTFADNFSDAYIDAGISGDIVTNAIEFANTTIHEVGHALGLEHYLDTAHKHAFMYTPDYGLNRSRWSSGINEPGAMQDDMSVIARAHNTFGYRADDVPAGGVTLTASAGNTYTTAGVIHQTSDTDVFRFSGSGATTITLEIPEHWGHLDGEIVLRDESGALLASSDTADKLGTSLAFTLPGAGTYSVEVASDGGEAEVGQYALIITTGPLSTGGTIAGRTFSDTNYNGIFETALGDAIIGDVVVYLDANDNAAFDEGEQSTISSTADGAYTFTGLAAGTYIVRQVEPTDHANAQAITRVITAAGETYGDTDFGNFPLVYSGGSGNDMFILRFDPGDPTRVEILRHGLGYTYSAPTTLVTSLTFNGGGGNDVLSIDAALSVPVVFNGGLDATSTDRLIVNAGAYTFDANARNGTANLELIVNAGAAVAFNVTQHLQRLELNGGFASMAVNGSLVVATHELLLANGGTFDLRDNNLIVYDEPTGTFNGTTYDGVTGYIASAYDFGAWDLPGIMTSMPDAGPLVGKTTLGIATGAQVLFLAPGETGVWGGETVTSSTTIVMYTYAGDVDLNGYVDAVDYGTIDQWIQFPGTNGYTNGDLNFDGVIDAVDYGIIDNGIQLQGDPL